MSVPALDELPTPLPGKTGWPWTKASAPLPEARDDGTPWPRISIVTPSYNQGQFIEETIRSVLLQGYPNLEYIVIDGGSTDESAEIIEAYAPWLDYWVSEPDRGQSHAINKGFRKATGVYASWINSDDMLAPRALADLGRKLDAERDATTIYAGVCIYVDGSGRALEQHQGRVHSFEDLVDVGRVWRGQPARGHIVQPETLFPLALFKTVGGVDEENPRTMDYDLWGRMLLAGGAFEYVDTEVCRFRKHDAQKTADMWEMTKSLTDTALRLVERHPTWSPSQKQGATRRIKSYRKEVWHGTGRLARLRLPEPLVESVRTLRSSLT